MEEWELNNGKKVELRRATPEDASLIVDYIRKVCAETDNLTFGIKDMPITVESEIVYLNAIQSSETSTHLIVLCQGRVIATSNISTKSRPRLAHVASLGISVLREYWSMGIGSKLMNEMINWAKNGGIIKKINLSVRSDNHHAISLYQKCGFRYVGTLHDEMRIEGQSVDLDMMELLLQDHE